MLQAWLVSPEESLYFAAPETPCSWATLRRHVLKMQRRLHGRLRVALHLGGSGVGAGSVEVTAFLESMTAAGVETTLAADESSGTRRPPPKADVGSSRGGVLGRAWGSSGHAANQSRSTLRGGHAIVSSR